MREAMDEILVDSSYDSNYIIRNHARIQSISKVEGEHNFKDKLFILGRWCTSSLHASTLLIVCWTSGKSFIHKLINETYSIFPVKVWGY